MACWRFYKCKSYEEQKNLNWKYCDMCKRSSKKDYYKPEEDIVVGNEK